MADVLQLKLVPVLIPKPLWGINAHDLMARDTWERMRRDTFQRDQGCCVICLRKRILECHEVFSYDDAVGIAVLIRLESRCADCHASNHLGRLLKRNPEAFKRALAYIGRLNQIGPDEVTLLVKDAFRLHKNRTRAWELKVAEDLLRQYPELGKMEGHY
ncbi:MAG TPA: hypothetical protein VKH81_05110 [Candidatus Angelobacter sp.]|nr:hypothetical protein [Candidatus Angelobacter sp.]